ESLAAIEAVGIIRAPGTAANERPVASGHRPTACLAARQSCRARVRGWTGRPSGRNAERGLSTAIIPRVSWHPARGVAPALIQRRQCIQFQFSVRSSIARRIPSGRAAPQGRTGGVQKMADIPQNLLSFGSERALL